MIDELAEAFGQTLCMLEDGVRKVPDEHWRQGNGDFLIPVRIVYHIMIGLEWFVAELPEDQHRKTRRYNLDWKGSIDEMPDRPGMLDDLGWIGKRIDDWFAKWRAESVEGAASSFRLRRALYFLRHTQHHVGEFCAMARVLGLERPAWVYPQFVPASVRRNP